MFSHRSERVVSSLSSAGAVLLAFWGSAFAGEHLVRDQASYREALKAVEPGDEIVLANGEWADFQIVFEATGTSEAPITLRAETPGEVFITGQSNLRIGGHHLVVQGLTFRDGMSPTGEVVSFRRDSETLAHNVRFTENVIEGFNKEHRSEQDSWVVLFGQNNRVDHNAFLGKTNKGPTLIVRLSTEESQENGHLIENNFFGGRAPLGGNGGETLRIGVSQTSRTMSRTIVRRNYFERCDGEVEIISIKSQGNLVTENVFYESRGSVVFRHGGLNEVTRNVFLGNGVADTGGIRVINDNQTIADNYLEGLRGEKFLGALVVMNGVPNSPENRYHQVENASIHGNSFIDVAHIGLGVGSDEERSAAPIDSEVSRNVFLSSAADPVGIFDDISGIAFANNVSNNAAFQQLGVQSIGDISLERGANGLAVFQGSGSGDRIGAPADLSPIGRDETGPAFYKKAPQTLETGTTRRINASFIDLRDAIAAAEAGDVLVLPARRINLDAPLVLDKPVTIRGSGHPNGWRKTVLASSASGAFVMRAGGRLTLENVKLDQRSDNKALIHASADRYEGDYSLNLSRVSISSKLEQAGPFISADPETFASAIVIDELTVRAWPAAVLDLSGEGLEGWYLSDDISVQNSSFKGVAGPVVRFGREGRDESTFGPRFSMRGSSLNGVGLSDGAIELSGIDGLDVSGNSIVSSGAIDIRRRVLGFPFDVSGNTGDGASVLSVLGVNGEPLDFDLTGDAE